MEADPEPFQLWLLGAGVQATILGLLHAPKLVKGSLIQGGAKEPQGEKAFKIDDLPGDVVQRLVQWGSGLKRLLVGSFLISDPTASFGKDVKEKLAWVDLYGGANKETVYTDPATKEKKVMKGLVPESISAGDGYNPYVTKAANLLEERFKQASEKDAAVGKLRPPKELELLFIGVGCTGRNGCGLADLTTELTNLQWSVKKVTRVDPTVPSKANMIWLEKNVGMKLVEGVNFFSILQTAEEYLSDVPPMPLDSDAKAAFKAAMSPEAMTRALTTNETGLMAVSIGAKLSAVNYPNAERVTRSKIKRSCSGDKDDGKAGGEATKKSKRDRALQRLAPYNTPGPKFKWILDGGKAKTKAKAKT